MKILELTYVFDASAKTIVFSNWPSGLLKKEYLLLITNVVDGVIIYNFADPAKGGTIASDAGGDILTLDYDTTSMSDTDELQIYMDDGRWVAADDTVWAVIDDTTAIKNRLPSAIGQTTKAASLSVALASDQDALPITNSDLAAIKTAVEVIDNFISGSRGLVTEDNSAAIKTAVETIDNFISGSRGLVTEDNSSAISGGIGATADAIVAAGAAGSLSAKLRRVTQGLEDLKTLIVLAAGSAIIGKVGIDQTTPGTTNGVQVNAALPAGTNNIGDVDVLTLPAIPAGTNNIGDVDVLTVPADPFGANADAAVSAGAAGSIQAKLRRATQGLEDLKTAIVLAAGTNAIGKLAANSGVDIGDVDVTSLPALAAGTNLIGKVSSADRTDTIFNGTTELVPKFAKIDRATNADGAAVVNLVSAKKIRVIRYSFVCAGTVSAKWQSSTSNSTGAGSNTDLTGLMSFVANTGIVEPNCPQGIIETVAGEALKLNLNAGTQVSGSLTYIEV